MSVLRNRPRRVVAPLLTPLVAGVLAACNGSDRRIDEQLRADLLAASQAPAARQQYASPAELGYPPGYVSGGQPATAPYPSQNPSPYPPPPRTRVVYVPQGGSGRRAGTVAARASSIGEGGEYRGGSDDRRQTQKGALIGAASGAAIGVIASRDKAKGAAIGALGGAVLGGLIGHQVRNPD